VGRFLYLPPVRVCAFINLLLPVRTSSGATLRLGPPTRPGGALGQAIPPENEARVLTPTTAHEDIKLAAGQTDWDGWSKAGIIQRRSGQFPPLGHARRKRVSADWGTGICMQAVHSPKACECRVTSSTEGTGPWTGGLIIHSHEEFASPAT